MIKNNYFKIHQAYLINKVNLIVIGLVIISGVIFNLSPIFGYKKTESYFNRSDIYNQIISNNTLFFKIFFININGFLYGSFFNKNNDLYHLLVSDYKHHKIKYFITKYLLLVITTFIIVFSIFIIASIILKSYYNWYIIDINYFRLLINILLLSIVYGTLSVITSKLINSQVSCFIPNIFFIFGELITNKTLSSGYNLFFPTISQTTIYLSSYGEIHLLILIVIYSITALGCSLYVKK